MQRPPPVPGVKGYSFAGWDKSYVNINPGTRSMAVDITAQYQLTSGIQNPGSLTDLANALMALGVPVAVKNGFITLGAAIINPFDLIILDLLTATALVGTIIYYWDDIKGLWEDIKTVFRNFAGQDAAGEILDNIEEGLEEKGETDSQAPVSINYDPKQVGKKYGKHKEDYPDMKDSTDYTDYADEVFDTPDKIIHDKTNGEYYYTKGKDLLRIKENGDFVSLYPGAESGRVLDAIQNGGVIWPQP